MYKNTSLMFEILIDKFEKTIISLSNKKELFIFSIIFGLFLAPLMSYYVPLFRYIFIFLIIVYVFVVYICKDKDVWILFLFLSSLIILNVYSYYSLRGTFDFSSFHIYFLMLIGYILAKENLLNRFIPYVKFILIVNFYFLINEKLTGIPLVPFGEGRELSLVTYGQGIFGYTKNAADAIGLSILLFRKKIFWKFIILLSVFLIGVRSAILLVGLIIIIDFILFIKIKITPKIFLKSILFILISGISIYFLKDLFFLDRIEALFRSESLTYTSRFYYSTLHNNLFSQLSVFQILFGSGTYIPEVIGNGSESLHIMFYTHYGIFNYTLWITFFFYIIYSKIIIRFYFVYPLILFLLLGMGVRFGLGWMGGIILYTYLFNIYFNRKESF